MKGLFSDNSLTVNGTFKKEDDKYAIAIAICANLMLKLLDRYCASVSCAGKRCSAHARPPVVTYGSAHLYDK